MSNTYFTEAWRAVAIAKISEFSYQAERLGQLARCYVVNQSEAASTLHDIAEAHSLKDTFGLEYINIIIAEAFVPPAVQAEAAE